VFEQEIERRKYETEEQKEALIPELRGISRQEYLKKREDKKLQELKDELEDEMLLFGVSTHICHFLPLSSKLHSMLDTSLFLLGSHCPLLSAIP
jgi:hypothetical protein